MSRTHKTDPLWVRMRKGTIHAYPVHSHENGICDLPPLEEKDNSYRRNGCYWEFDPEGKGICGCSLCRGKGWNDSQDPKIQRKHFKSKARSTDFDNI